MELKDVLSTLGLEEVKDLDGFKQKFQGKFITKDEAYNDEEIKGKITGKITGAFNTKFKKMFELEAADIEGKKWEEIAELGVSKFKDVIKELEVKSGQSNDEALKDYKLKLEKANTAILEYKEQNETLSKGLETTEKTWSEKYTGLKKNNILESSKSKLSAKLRDMNDFERKGFDAAIKENIIIEFDEKEELVVKGSDGKRIPNPNKIGAFLSLDEALELQAVTGNLIKKNDGGGKPNPFQAPQSEQQPSGGQQAQRTVHPNALKHSETLRAGAAGN